MSESLTLFEREAIRLAMVKMFAPSGYFDICAIDTCCKLARVTPPERTYTALRAMHCIHWSAMSPAMVQEVADTVLGLFALPGVDLSSLNRTFFPSPVRIDTSPAASHKRGLVQRLLGRGAA